jgi:2-polyprenyl-3-methyl-5-hydroxy-6-metoxy-1,4-benzoquinol methylase
MILEQNNQSFDCPLCKGNDYDKIKTFSDNVVVGKCKSCGLTYTPVRHDTPEDLFGKISMDQLYTMYGPIISGKKRHFRYQIFHKYLNKIEQFHPGKRQLDVGCAHGFFIDICKKRGYDVTGIEPNEGMAEFGRKFLNLTIHNGTLDQITLTNKWDLITFTDSLEYFKAPVEDLTHLVDNHLNKNGIVFIKVPNGDYFHARHTLKKMRLALGNAEAYSPSKRVVHYTDKTVGQLIQTIGLKPLKIGYFLPIDSPVWYKHVGIHLEMENPWWLGVKEKVVRKILHSIGLIEYVLLKKNHFSQSVYILAKKL